MNNVSFPAMNEPPWTYWISSTPITSFSLILIDDMCKKPEFVSDLRRTFNYTNQTGATTQQPWEFSDNKKGKLIVEQNTF